MAIETLSDRTVRAIGAAQVLTDPAAVVKELVDNALDARATSISVEISSNTVDSIQLRDNGRGIPPADRAMVARPHCTSKLESADDLSSIGGSSLGFRGEALASVANMSGTLTISTRVEGEPVAAVLKIDQRGEVVGQERGSLPVGTTIKVTDFVKVNPVRKQMALKNSEKCLKRIKQVLQSYAFARPHVRLVLKVLKAKTDKYNLTYAPKPEGNAEDAAFKIVGAACASQCAWSVIEEDEFTLQAFLPRADAEPSKISNLGAFISVDARPVSTARGTAKNISKMFRDALKATSGRLEGTKDPFIFLEIDCPRASYDANVEPAKDDVIFENPLSVLNAVRRLFEAMYPVEENTPGDAWAIKSTHGQLDPRFVSGENGLEISSEQVTNQHRIAESTPPPGNEETSHILSADSERPPNAAREAASNKRSSRSNMHGYDEEDMDFPQASIHSNAGDDDEFEELRRVRKDVTVNNPWTMAKLNSSSRPRSSRVHNMPTESPDESSSPSKQSLAAAAKAGYPIDLEAPGLPTPRPSSPFRASQAFHPSDFVPQIRLAGDGRVIETPSLPPPQPHSFSSQAEPTSNRVYGDREQENIAENMPSSGTPLHAIPDFARSPRRSPQRRPQQGPTNRPFVPPFKDQQRLEKVWFDHLEQGSPERCRPQGRRFDRRPANESGLVAQGELGDFVEEARPLTPPTRNRDMRDFVTTLHLTGSRAGASRAPQSTEQSPNHDASEIDDHGPQPRGEENPAPVANMIGTRGFIPASKIAAMSAHPDPSDPEPSERRPPKRRKTNEGQTLRETDGNAPSSGEDDGTEARPPAHNRRASRRQKTADGSPTKPGRRKTSQLPLERVPAGQGMQGVVCHQSWSVSDVVRSVEYVDEEASFLAYSEPALDVYDAFDVAPEEMQGLAGKLKALLVCRVSDGEMVQDLEELVQEAIAAREDAFAEAVVEAEEE